MVFRRQREHISTIRLHSVIHVGSRRKIQDRRQIKNTENTETKDNPEKANNTKYSKTKLPGLVVFTTLGQETR